MVDISVVTLSYNQAGYLEECLRSVLNQDYNRVEYIVVDPGSGDTSRDIIARYVSRLSSVILEPDEGPADGLNKGFTRAKGDVFCYINADDRLFPGSLRFAANYFKAHPEVDVLCGAINMLNEKGRVAWRKRTSDYFRLSDYAAGISTVCQQATFIRRRAFEEVGGFNRANRVSWDGELLVDMALAGCQFATVDRVLGEFRIYKETITGSKRFQNQIRDEHSRMVSKMEAAGVALYPPVEASIRRFMYKANLRRHVGYYVVR